jgi:hypothetical protein
MLLRSDKENKHLYKILINPYTIHFFRNEKQKENENY